MEDSDLANILVVNNANRIEYVVLRQYPVKPSRCLYKPAGPWVASSSTPSPLSDPTAANNENNKNNINIINNNSSVNDTSPLHSWPTLQLTRMSHFRSSLLFKELERALDHGFAAMWLRKDRSRLTLDDLLDDAVVDMCDCELWIFSWSVRCPASSYIPESSLVHESTRGEFTSMDITILQDRRPTTLHRNTRCFLRACRICLNENLDILALDAIFCVILLHVIGQPVESTHLDYLYIWHMGN
ncbi:hypothetical protein BASA60_000771 [Batrachochytrium salamandrivorans]|nr:hypothetical protein BASA60_000771 [Batrachochytrium salamandrivorans]